MRSLDKHQVLLEQDKKDLEALLISGLLSEQDKKVNAKYFCHNTQAIKTKKKNLNIKYYH